MLQIVKWIEETKKVKHKNWLYNYHSGRQYQKQKKRENIHPIMQKPNSCDIFNLVTQLIFPLLLILYHSHTISEVCIWCAHSPRHYYFIQFVCGKWHMHSFVIHELLINLACGMGSCWNDGGRFFFVVHIASVWYVEVFRFIFTELNSRSNLRRGRDYLYSI